MVNSSKIETVALFSEALVLSRVPQLNCSEKVKSLIPLVFKLLNLSLYGSQLLKSRLSYLFGTDLKTATSWWLEYSHINMLFKNNI